MNSMPKPSDEHRRLHVLAGSFVGDEVIAPSPWGPGGQAVGRFSGQVVCDGFFVAQDYVEEKDGQLGRAELVKLHLMSDENGDAPISKLNDWEGEVVKHEEA